MKLTKQEKALEVLDALAVVRDEIARKPRKLSNGEFISLWLLSEGFSVRSNMRFTRFSATKTIEGYDLTDVIRVKENLDALIRVNKFRNVNIQMSSTPAKTRPGRPAVSRVTAYFVLGPK